MCQVNPPLPALFDATLGVREESPSRMKNNSQNFNHSEGGRLSEEFLCCPISWIEPLVGRANFLPSLPRRLPSSALGASVFSEFSSVGSRPIVFGDFESSTEISGWLASKQKALDTWAENCALMLPGKGFRTTARLKQLPLMAPAPVGRPFSAALEALVGEDVSVSLCVTT